METLAVTSTMSDAAIKTEFWRLIKKLSTRPVSTSTKEGGADKLQLNFEFIDTITSLEVICIPHDGGVMDRFTVCVVREDLRYTRTSSVEGLGQYDQWFKDLVSSIGPKIVDHSTPIGRNDDHVPSITLTVGAPADTAMPSVNNTNIPVAPTPAEAVPTSTEPDESQVQREAALGAALIINGIAINVNSPQQLKRFFETSGLSVHYEELFGETVLTLASEGFFNGPAFSYMFAKASDWDELLDEFVKNIK